MEGSAASERICLRFAALALLVASLAVGGGSVARAASTPTETVRILVHFRAGTDDARRAEVAASIGGRVERELRAIGVTRIAAPIEHGADAWSLVAAIAGDPSVSLVEPDTRVHLQFTPNDPLWSTDPYVGLGQWGQKKIFLDRAIDLVRSAQPITVAVVDTGVDAGHPDLAGVVGQGRTFLTGASPECTAFGAAFASDDNSHGTHVAGIIAAVSNNGIGIAGIAANARILPIKALDCTGSGAVSDIAEGITYAVDQGARVVNISLGSSNSSATLAAAVQYAVSRNVLIVAAAGNCAQAQTRCLGTANLVEYPAAYPGVLGVGATSMDDSIAPFSTQGPQVGVSAPGLRIVSTTPQYVTYQSQRGASTGYASFSGTSQATPFVAGLAALLLGVDPALTAPQLADRIRTTADDLGVPGADPAFGAGRINALRAVTQTLPAYSARYDTAAVPRSATSAGSFVARVTITNTSPVMWLASGADAVKLAYHWLDANGNVALWDGVRTLLPTDLAPGATITINASVTAPPTRGAYVLRFDLVRDGLAWFSQRGVAGADVPVAVGSGLGATYAPAATSATVLTAAPAPLSVTLTNSGTRPWSAGGPQPMRLSYHWLRSGSVVVWDGARAPAFASDVQPGQTITVQIPVVAPAGVGAYTLRLDLVQEGVSWFSTEGVAARDLAYVVTSGYSASYVPSGGMPAVLPGGRATARVVVKNDGVVAWSATGANPVRLAAHVADAAGNMIVWDGPRTSLRSDVAAGSADTYLVTVDAPLAAGAYRARVDLVREGVEWFSGLGVATVDVPLTVTADYRAQLGLAPGVLSVSRAAPTVSLALANITSVVWTTSGAAPVRIAVHWYDASGDVVIWDGPRTDLGRDVAPGETVTLNVLLGTPPAGASAVAIDLVSEGVRWFGAAQKRSVALLP